MTATVVACSSPSRSLPTDGNVALEYVALGDSTVEGVGASGAARTYVALLHDRLRARYPKARVDNLGASGARSSDVVATQLDRAIGLRPDLVTLSVGPNDITSGVGVGSYERSLETILRRLTEETRAVVVVNLVPDLSVTPRFRGTGLVVGRLSAEFNAAIRKTAKRHGARVVDLYAASRDEVPKRPELVADDGYHPSDLGYARWAELMWAVLQ